MLIKIFKKYSDFDICYIPHRSEELSQYRNIFDKYNISIIKTSLPIELYFLKNGIYPHKIVSFTSTCLFTLNILFKDTEIISILFHENDIGNLKEGILTHREFIKQTEGIKTIYSSLL